MRRAGTPRRDAGGFTLIEVLVVVALLGLVMGVAVRGLRSLAKSDMRSSAVKMAGAIRYLFDRASTTGRIHRLVVDFEEHRYWAEVSDDRFYMPRDRETDLQREEDAEALAKEEEEAKERQEQGGEAAAQYDITRYQPQEFQSKRARFSAFKEMAVKPAAIKGAKLHSIFTPRLAAPQTTGRGYIYFFPLGMTEAAQVYISDEGGQNIYSLVVHPLTGRVEVINRYVDPPVDEQFDDAGEKIER
jgi:prepilin-type N-terminal cleavage/methylation domain-containing protein